MAAEGVRKAYEIRKTKSSSSMLCKPVLSDIFKFCRLPGKATNVNVKFY